MRTGDFLSRLRQQVFLQQRQGGHGPVFLRTVPKRGRLATPNKQQAAKDRLEQGVARLKTEKAKLRNLGKLDEWEIGVDRTPEV